MQENIISSYFNSIKVQLEPLLYRNISDAFIFQFHKGTIRTYQPFCFLLHEQTHFNSIKVQLEQDRFQCSF